MSVWGEVFLGVIAAATLAIAVVLVGLVVAAGRLARHAGQRLDHLEGELRPIFDHLNAIGRDASRAAEAASAQVQRVDRLFADLTERLDHAARSVQDTLAGPAREGRAILAALALAIRAIRGARGRRHSEEDDALFI